MSLDFVKPFVESFETVMPQLGFENLQMGSIAEKTKDLVYSGVIIVVGLVGDKKGNVVYCLDIESAKKIASTMMMGMPIDEFDDMAQSALSELTNMLTANAATCFANIGMSIDISTPTLLHGNNISAKMSSNNVQSITLFSNDISIEINIAIEA